MMNHYKVFGLTIASALELPELLPGDGDPDIQIGLGEVVPLGPAATGQPDYIEALGDRVCITIQDVGRFLITGAYRVTVEPLPEADERALRIYLVGMVLGVLLARRGRLVFHASAVSIPPYGAVAFMGAKRVGKSTTAGAFFRRGGTVLSDDILALERRGDALHLLPGFPRLKLTSEALASLGDAFASPGAIDPLMQDRCPVSTAARFSDQSLPLRRIYLLESAESLAITPLEAREAVMELLPHWYGSQFGLPMIEALGRPVLLEQSVELARRIPVCRLSRPRDLARLDDLIALVKSDLAATLDPCDTLARSPLPCPQ